MSSQLEEVLTRKKEQLLENAVDRQATLTGWLRQVHALFDTIREWLRPLEEKGLVSIGTSEVAITEQLLGTYQAPSLTITFFDGEKAHLTPKGLYISVGKGRVDLQLGLREVMIVGQDEPQGWFFAERIGRGAPREFEFTRDNFEQLLQEYLESA